MSGNTPEESWCDCGRGGFSSPCQSRTATTLCYMFKNYVKIPLNIYSNSADKVLNRNIEFEQTATTFHP